MTKTIREYQRMCNAEGFELYNISVSGRHCRLEFAAGIVFAASTPSDHRNMINVRAQVRRLHYKH